MDGTAATAAVEQAAVKWHSRGCKSTDAVSEKNGKYLCLRTLNCTHKKSQNEKISIEHDLHHHKRQSEYTKRVLTADFELAVSRNLHPHMNKINSPNEARKKKIDDMSGVCQ